MSCLNISITLSLLKICSSLFLLFSIFEIEDITVPIIIIIIRNRIFFFCLIKYLKNLKSKIIRIIFRKYKN